MIVAFNQQYVTRPQGCPQRVGVRRCEWLVTLYRLFQVARQKAPHPIDHPAHDRPSAPILGAQDVPLPRETSRARLTKTYRGLIAIWFTRLFGAASCRCYRLLVIIC